MGSPTVSSPVDIPEGLQSDIDDPDEPDDSGSERNTRGKNKPGGTKDDNVGIITLAPVLDKILGTQRHERPPGVKLKNTARVQFEEPISDSRLRGEIDIIDEFSSQPGIQGASSKQDKTCESASDIILLSKRLHDAEFPMLRKTTLEVDHNFFPWRGSESKEKWTDIIKKNMK